VLTGCLTKVVYWHHGRRSISDLRLSVAIRTDARIDSFFLQVILVRPERRRFAKAAVRALVFPGINDQIVFFKMVIRTREIVSRALGAIANLLAFTRHLFADKRVIWTVLGGRGTRTQPASPSNIGHRHKYRKSELVLDWSAKVSLRGGAKNGRFLRLDCGLLGEDASSSRSCVRVSGEMSPNLFE